MPLLHIYIYSSLSFASKRTLFLSKIYEMWCADVQFQLSLKIQNVTIGFNKHKDGVERKFEFHASLQHL